MIQDLAIPPEEVRRALDQVLAGPDFAPVPRTLLERLVDWLGSLGSLGTLGDGIGVLLGLLIVPLLVLLGGLVLASLEGRRRSRAAGAEPERRPVTERVAELRARAAQARDAGDLRLALRLYLFALVVGLGRRGDLEYRDAWTHRELLARGHPSAEVAAELGPLVDELDRKLFGGGPSTPADVERLAALCERFLGPPQGAARTGAAGGAR